jgi:predicted trehalose synthase
MSDAATNEQPEQRPTSEITSDHVAAWMADQRWYAAKGVAPRLREIARIEATVDGVDVSSRFIIDEGPDDPVLYQVPMTERRAAEPGLEHALVATDGDRWLYDGPHDPAYVQWLLATIAADGVLEGAGATIAGRSLVSPGTLTSASVLRGEQSNTSIICDVSGGPVPQIIVKVFRVLHHGDNPDVTTQAALTTGGSRRVPASYGSLQGTWPDSGRPEGTATGDLAFAQEFLPGLEDAWRVALRAASEGVSFADRARDLGRAVAEVHQVLATQLPTIEADQAARSSVLSSMRARLDTAVRDVPEVAAFASAIEQVYADADALEWPTFQRIHGDLHLGQVLDAPGRGWVLLDFEGEPLRPMPERSRPDVTLRDVAGMLRSFDYVAGTLARQTPAVDASAWAEASRVAFVEGYGEVSGSDLRGHRQLLDVFELDKAVYETVYETRNRPGWVAMPLAAIERLLP